MPTDKVTLDRIVAVLQDDSDDATKDVAIMEIIRSEPPKARFVWLEIGKMKVANAALEESLNPKKVYKPDLIGFVTKPPIKKNSESDIIGFETNPSPKGPDLGAFLKFWLGVLCGAVASAVINLIFFMLSHR
jgi:hypothetical protein